MQAVRSKPRWLALIAAVLGGVIMLVAPAQGATSAAARPLSGGGDGCNPGRSNNYLTYYFDGAFSQDTGSSGTPGGVYASISNYSPWVSAANSGDDSSEWVMLDQQPPSTGLWVQIGWVEFAGAQRDTFDEYSLGPGAFHDDYYAPFSINSNHTYEVTYNPNSEYAFNMEVDGNYYNDQINIFTPNDAQIFAEIHTQASQIPGGTEDTASQEPVVSNAHVYPNAGTGGGWQNFDGYTQANEGTNGGSKPSWMAESPAPGTSGVDSWRTWDRACLH